MPRPSSRSSGWAWLVSAQMNCFCSRSTRASHRRMAWAHRYPFMTGISMSRKTKSYSRVCICAKACQPFWATSTTYPFRSKVRCR